MAHKANQLLPKWVQSLSRESNGKGTKIEPTYTQLEHLLKKKQQQTSMLLVEDIPVQPGNVFISLPMSNQTCGREAPPTSSSIDPLDMLASCPQ